MICHYAERNCAECRNLFSVMLGVIVLYETELNVVMLVRWLYVFANLSTISYVTRYLLLI